MRTHTANEGVGTPLKSVKSVKSARSASRTRYVLANLYRCRYLYLMLLPVVIYFAVFQYGPMYGAILAFKDFNPMLGIWGSPWAGTRFFEQFFNSYFFWRLIRNTLVISFLHILLGFPAPIILALMLSELRSERYKRVVQTGIYLPWFISLVVAAGMILTFLSTRAGILNNIITTFGGDAIPFMTIPRYFPWIFAISSVWREAGWGSIIFLAAIAGIDPGLHEAAVIDGASRFKRIIYVTLPGIMPTIMIMFILRMGALFTVGFEKIMLLYNPQIFETADVIQTFVYRRGILGFEFSFSTAVGLFNSLINMIVLIMFNTIARKLGQASLW